MSTDWTDLNGTSLGPWLATLLRGSRLATGWSQAELARRSGTSESHIRRLEAAVAPRIDLAVVERALAALGLRGRISTFPIVLGDRERQNDAVHAVVNGFTARHLARLAWTVLTEVQVGDPNPLGWVDLVGWREADRALLIEEAKGEIRDVGELQRQVAFYEGNARRIVRQQGWDPRVIVTAVVALDSAAVSATLANSRDLVEAAFPGRVDDLLRWLADPVAPPPGGRTLAVADPRTRAADWLRAPVMGASRRKPRFTSYADAAARLTRRPTSSGEPAANRGPAAMPAPRSSPPRSSVTRGGFPGVGCVAQPGSRGNRPELPGSAPDSRHG